MGCAFPQQPKPNDPLAYLDGVLELSLLRLWILFLHSDLLTTTDVVSWRFKVVFYFLPLLCSDEKNLESKQPRAAVSCFFPDKEEILSYPVLLLREFIVHVLLTTLGGVLEQSL